MYNMIYMMRNSHLWRKWSQVRPSTALQEALEASARAPPPDVVQEERFKRRTGVEEERAKQIGAEIARFQPYTLHPTP